MWGCKRTLQKEVNIGAWHAALLLPSSTSRHSGHHLLVLKWQWDHCHGWRWWWVRWSGLELHLRIRWQTVLKVRQQRHWTKLSQLSTHNLIWDASHGVLGAIHRLHIGRLCPGTICKILGLGNIDPCIDLFITLESTVLPNDVLCCSSKGIADHCACHGNLRLTFVPAPNCLLKLGTGCSMNYAGRLWPPFVGFRTGTGMVSIFGTPRHTAYPWVYCSKVIPIFLMF